MAGKKLAFGSGRFDSLTDLLDLLFVLVVMPGANGGIDEAAEKEEEADKKHDARHSTVETMSSSHCRSLCHEITLSVYPALRAIRLLSHREAGRSIINHVKKGQLRRVATRCAFFSLIKRNAGADLAMKKRDLSFEFAPVERYHLPP